MLDFLREPEEHPELFFSLVDDGIHGLIRFAALNAASTLHLFDHLEKGPGTLQELSHTTGIDEGRLFPLLGVLISAGVIVCAEGKYQNSPLASTYLVSISPYSQNSHIHKNALFLEKIWACLPKRLTGEPLIIPHTEFFANLALPAMAENALTGRLQRTVAEIAGMPEFASAGKMVDLGGGHGLYAIALSALNPGLDAYIFDLPHITALAERYIRKYHAARVFTIPGDFFSDDIGGRYDLILSSSNPSGKSAVLLRKIADAMNDGGLFVNIQSDNGDRDDVYHAFEWQLWTLDNEEKGKGHYSREQPFMTAEYREAMAKAGFRILLEKQIRDDYHRGSSVHMVIAKKVTG
jgi:predicted TPR repeat methyltransferase